MKRRDALRNIMLISAGIAVIPSCYQDVPVVDFPQYKNLSLDRNQWFLIDQIAEAILPVRKADASPIPEETVAHFILKSINDCYTPEDRVLYRRGFEEFVSVVQEKYLRQTADTLKLENVSDNQLNDLLDYMTDREGANARKDFPKSQQYFFDTTKSLAVRHFTNSEYFLKNQMDWEFAPGRFLGKVKI